MPSSVCFTPSVRLQAWVVCLVASSIVIAVAPGVSIARTTRSDRAALRSLVKLDGAFARLEGSKNAALRRDGRRITRRAYRLMRKHNACGAVVIVDGLRRRIAPLGRRGRRLKRRIVRSGRYIIATGRTRGCVFRSRQSRTVQPVVDGGGPFEPPVRQTVPVHEQAGEEDYRLKAGRGQSPAPEGVEDAIDLGAGAASVHPHRAGAISAELGAPLLV